MFSFKSLSNTKPFSMWYVFLSAVVFVKVTLISFQNVTFGTKNLDVLICLESCFLEKWLLQRVLLRRSIGKVLRLWSTWVWQKCVACTLFLDEFIEPFLIRFNGLYSSWRHKWWGWRGGRSNFNKILKLPQRWVLAHQPRQSLYCEKMETAQCSYW